MWLPVAGLHDVSMGTPGPALSHPAVPKGLTRLSPHCPLLSDTGSPPSSWQGRGARRLEGENTRLESAEHPEALTSCSVSQGDSKDLIPELRHSSCLYMEKKVPTRGKRTIMGHKNG